MADKLNGNKMFAEGLRAYGVTHFFHVPVIMPPSVIEMVGRGLHPIVAHTEKAAAYMADGYARASGRIGVCGSQSVGAANLSAGLLDAHMARSPILAITGGGTPQSRHRNWYQEHDQRGFFSGVTKFDARVETGDRFPDLLRQAIRAATTGQPGPTHLEMNGFWGTVGMEPVSTALAFEPQYGLYPPFRPAADPALITQLLACLARAERPVVVAGSGIRTSRADQALLAFVRAAQIPVATSLDAKAAIPESEPLSLGVVGDYSREGANKAVSEADFVLFVGTTTGSMVTRNWTVPRPGIAAAQIDIEPRELGRNYPVEVAIMADPGAALEQLTAAIGQSAVRSAWLDRVATLRQEWRDQAAETEASTAVPLLPQRLCRELSDALPQGALVVVDTGHAAAWACRHIYLDKPGQGLLRPAGSLGWAFPAALGAKCADAARPVVCFTGDGGFMYHMSEMETAVRYGINTVTVVNNNASFSQERTLWRDDPNLAKNWAFSPVDYAKTAEAFGCAAYTVESPGELSKALTEAVTLGRPVVIDARSCPQTMAPMSWAPSSEKTGYGEV